MRCRRPSAAVEQRNCDALAKLMCELEREMANEGPFLVSSEFTAADASLVPFIQRIVAEFPQVLDDTKRWKLWWEAVSSRASVEGTLHQEWWWWW